MTLTPNEQYHSINKLIRAFEHKTEADRSVLVCGYAYCLDHISEFNLINLIRYAEVSLDNSTNSRIFHFLVYNQIIAVEDNDLGFLRSLSNIQPNENYNEGAKEFALKEMHRIGGMLSDE